LLVPKKRSSILGLDFFSFNDYFNNTKKDTYVPPRKLRFPMSGEKMLRIFSYLFTNCNFTFLVEN
jgi:hypothetical protein